MLSDQAKVRAFFRHCIGEAVNSVFARMSADEKQAMLNELNLPEDIAIEVSVEQAWSKYEKALTIDSVEASTLLADLNYQSKATGEALARELVTGPRFQRTRENRARLNAALAVAAEKGIVMSELLKELLQRAQSMTPDTPYFQWWLELAARVFNAHVASAGKQ